MGGGTPTDKAIAQMKELKDKLIETLTAKTILAELVRPRKIEEEE